MTQPHTSTPSGTDLDAVDFFTDNRLLHDPYDYLAALREQCPVRREPHHDVVMITGYEEAVAVYNDNERFSSCTAVTGPFPGFPVPLEGDDISDLIAAAPRRVAVQRSIADPGSAAAHGPPGTAVEDDHAEAPQGE